MGTVYKPFFSELDISPLPFVKGIPTDPAVPAGFGYIMGNLLDVPNNPPSPFLVSSWIEARDARSRGLGLITSH